MTEAPTAVEGVGPLNLSDADLSGIEPIPSGTELRSEVFSAEWTAIKADSQGKMPGGTPGLKVQIKVLNEGEGSQYYNRRVFNNFWIPGEGYDKDKGAKMRGMLVNFLIAVGYSKEEVMNGSFQVDPDELQGREFIMRVGVKAAQKDSDGNEIYPAQNTLLAAKHLSEGAATPATSGLL